MARLIISGITRWRTGFPTMLLYVPCRIKKGFSGLAPRTDLTGSMAILLKFSGARLMIPVLLAAILFIVYMKTRVVYYGWEPKMDCLNTMRLPKALAF